jgi:hypothetical protein
VCCACADEAAAEVAERKASDELEHVHTIRLSAKARSFDWASYRPAALGQHVWRKHRPAMCCRGVGRHARGSMLHVCYCCA